VSVLFDTNVVLDVLLARQPHADAAAQLFALADTGRLEGVVCATTVTTVHYVAARAVGSRRAEALLRELLALFAVAPVDAQVLDRALDLDFTDFEDAVLHEAARAYGAGIVCTRNTPDFAKASLPVFTPLELLSAIRAAGD
jgi:predicted nucleic acid-binding protein